MANKGLCEEHDMDESDFSTCYVGIFARHGSCFCLRIFDIAHMADLALELVSTSRRWEKLGNTYTINQNRHSSRQNINKSLYCKRSLEKVLKMTKSQKEFKRR